MFWICESGYFESGSCLETVHPLDVVWERLLFCPLDRDIVREDEVRMNGEEGHRPMRGAEAFHREDEDVGTSAVGNIVAEREVVV